MSRPPLLQERFLIRVWNVGVGAGRPLMSGMDSAAAGVIDAIVCVAVMVSGANCCGIGSTLEGI